jgi:hypothetical protein
MWFGAVDDCRFGHFIVCSLAVFSNILKIPQIQVLADSDEQEVVQQVQVYVIYDCIYSLNEVLESRKGGWDMNVVLFCRSSMLTSVPLMISISL